MEQAGATLPKGAKEKETRTKLLPDPWTKVAVNSGRQRLFHDHFLRRHQEPGPCTPEIWTKGTRNAEGHPTIRLGRSAIYARRDEITVQN